MALNDFLKTALSTARGVQAKTKDFIDRPETREALAKAAKSVQGTVRSARELRESYRPAPTSLAAAREQEVEIDRELKQLERAHLAFDIETKQLEARRAECDDDTRPYNKFTNAGESIWQRAASLDRRAVELRDDRDILNARAATLATHIATLEAESASRRMQPIAIAAVVAEEEAAPVAAPSPAQPKPFVLGERWEPRTAGIYIATATGEFAAMNHASSPPPGARLVPAWEDLFKSILITGETGSGKTTGAYYPAIAQLAANGAGGLIFCHKKAAVAEVSWLLKKCGREPKVIGIGGEYGLNLLAGWDPVMASDAIADFLDRENSEQSLWLGLAKARVLNALFVLRLVPEYYTFLGLARYLFEDAFQAAIEKASYTAAAALKVEADALTEPIDAARKRKMIDTVEDYVTSLHWEKTQWAEGLREQMQDDTMSHLLKIMQVFHRSGIKRAWCGTDASLPEADLNRCFDGEIYIVASGLEDWGSDANFALALAKRRWFNYVISRGSRNEPHPMRPVFIGLDEFQDFADPNDGDMLGTLRQYCHVTIAATQGLTSIFEAIRNEKSARKIILNFVTHIALASSDTDGTIKYYSDLYGKTEQWRVSHSTQKGGGSSSNTGSSDGQSGSTSKGKSASSSFSKSSNAQQSQIDLVSAQSFHSLRKASKNRATGEVTYPTAIATVAIGEYKLSDVVVLEKPLFPSVGNTAIGAA